MKPLAIDLFAGLGGWTEGFLAEGYDVVGFDNERHVYGEQRYPAQLVLQDVLTLSGKQFRGAAVIVASPPCQEYSWMAMPWILAKQKAAWYREEYTRQLELNCLFNACFRIAHEAGVPLVVENVKGAQPWVGRANAHYGSFYLWGDIASVGGAVVSTQPRFGELVRARRAGGKANPDGTEHPQGSWFKVADSKERGQKNDGGSWFAIANNTTSGHGNNARDAIVDAGRKVGVNFQSTAVEENGTKVESETGRRTDVGKGARFTSRDCGDEGRKAMSSLHGFSYPDGNGGRDLGGPNDPRRFSSKSSARKAASAQIAKIPLPLSRHIARIFKP